MEKPIQAGMILKTKFVAAGNDKFTEYINYIDRVEAVRNDNFQKYDLFMTARNNFNRIAGQRAI